jgi:hypothetical protein
MGRQQTDGCPTCQVCGGLIYSKPYLWDGNPLLPMHRDFRQCQGRGDLAFTSFLGRNAAYLNGQGEPVLLPTEGQA